MPNINIPLVVKDVKLEGLKELGRVVLLFVISYLLSGVALNQVVDMAFGTTLDETTKLQIAVALTGLLKALDKYLHEYAKAEPKADRNEGLLGTKGLTGF